MGELCLFGLITGLGGKLIDITGNLGPRYMGVVRSATVSDASCSTGWKIRSRGS